LRDVPLTEGLGATQGQEPGEHNAMAWQAKAGAEVRVADVRPWLIWAVIVPLWVSTRYWAALATFAWRERRHPTSCLRGGLASAR
jgi:hypothetical protein